MMTPEKLAEAASILIASRAEGVKIDSLPEQCRPASAADSYAIQKEVLAQNRAAQIGWKVAATNAATQAAYGISEPFAGRLPAASPRLLGRSLAAGRPLPHAGSGTAAVCE